MVNGNTSRRFAGQRIPVIEAVGQLCSDSGVCETEIQPMGEILTFMTVFDWLVNLNLRCLVVLFGRWLDLNRGTTATQWYVLGMNNQGTTTLTGTVRVLLIKILRR